MQRTIIVIAISLVLLSAILFFWQRQQHSIIASGDYQGLTPKVAAYIEKNFGNDERKRKAVVQYAFSSKAMADNTISDDELGDRGYQALCCMGYAFNNRGVPEIAHKIKELTYDTPEKMATVLRRNQRASGKFFSIEFYSEAEACQQ